MGSGSGLGGCHACIKYLMFAFNFIFWLVGCALVGVGIWVLVDDQFKKLSSDSNFAALQYAGIGLIVIGSIIMIIGFFGCCGAIRESQCLLIMFSICLFLIFAGLVGASIFWLVNKDEFINTATEAFKAGIADYKEGGFIDLVQAVYKCCGAESSANYISNLKPVPASCPRLLGGTVDPTAPGCVTKMRTDLEGQAMILGGVAIGTAAIMLLGMIFAILLCCAIRDSTD